MNIPGIPHQSIRYTLLNYHRTQELIAEGLTEELIAILSQIEVAYPFTFLEKEGLRNKIDGLDNYFWIKNRYGFCELVNQKLTEYFNTGFAQLEGSHEEILFPVESRRIVKSFNDVVCETKKAVLAEGIGFIDEIETAKFNLINIPLIDEEDTVIALICLTVNPKVEKRDEIVQNYRLNSQTLDEIPFASAILSSEGSINKINKKFQELLGLEYHELENSLVNEVFLPSFVKNIEEFIASEATEIAMKSSELFPKQAFPILVFLGKIFDKRKSITAIMLCVKIEMGHNLAEEQQNNVGMIENLIRNNPDAVLICDKENLKFLEVNEIAINLYGYRKDEFLQMDLTDLYSAEDIQLLLDSSSVNVREGSFHGPYKHKKKDGTVILVEMSRYSVKFQDRQAHFNLVRNITDNLETEKRNKSYKSAFENTDDLIFITDSSGFIQSINHQVTKILGFTKNDLINSSFATLASDEDRGQVNLSIFHSNKKDESSISINLKTIDGRFLTVDVIASPILDFNKEIESYTLIGKVKPTIPSAESEVPKKTQEGSESKETIDTKFLADLFHELLTPINVILGFAQDITDSINQPTVEQKEASEIIRQNRTNLLQSMNTAIEFASLTEKDFNLLVTETKITDIIDLLVKDADELKKSMDVEFVYGKISSSLKFETDRQRFKYFLSLLFKTAAKISGQKKIYFSAFAQDKDYFLVTFRDLHTHSSKRLVTNLKNIFSGEGDSLINELGFSRIFVSVVQKLLKILKGKFVTLNEAKDNYDYGIIFPIIYSSFQAGEVEPNKISEELEQVKDKTIDVPKPISKEETTPAIPELNSSLKSKQKLKEADQLNRNLRNELKLEVLREKIRRKEEEKKSKKIKEEGNEIFENDHNDELIEDTIEFFDFDLQENSDDHIEEVIEIVETSAPKEKVVTTPKVQQTDEKVDISILSCLYFEDQIDSQVLFSVQMKGLKNLNFAVSFEESLPLLDSGNYDFIVIDINLQGSYNGLDILKILRSMARYENTPLFAVTAYVLPGDQQKFVLAGFNGFISKPIFRDQMIDVLAETFNEPKHS